MFIHLIADHDDNHTIDKAFSITELVGTTCGLVGAAAGAAHMEKVAMSACAIDGIFSLLSVLTCTFYFNSF